MSEEDIFGNPDLMPKLSAALKTITKRKRVKGKPLVDLIATVQRDGSLPACVQTADGLMTGPTSAPGPAPPPSSSSSLSLANRALAGAGVRRIPRPPALIDAIATSNEEYTANMEQAYGSIQPPGSSASDTASVSPALSSLGTSNSSAEEFSLLGWGHNSGGAYSQYSRQGTPANVRNMTGAVALGTERDAAVAAAGGDIHLHDTLLDSPTSSCSTIVADTSPGGGDRLSPGGSLSGGFSPVARPQLAPSHMQHQAVPDATSGMPATVTQTSAMSSGLQRPSSARSAGAGNSGAGSGGGGSGHHWGQRQPSSTGGINRRPKCLSTTSSIASTDGESLDTSHLLEFDEDDDDEGVPYGGSTYAGEPYGYGPQAVSGALGGRQRVSPEDLQELEDALLMDSFGGAMDDLLEGEDVEPGGGSFPELGTPTQTFPDLYNVGASLPPLARGGHAVGGGTGGSRGTPRLSPAGGASSPRMPPQMLGDSPSHAGSASPVSAAAAATSGFPLAGSNNGPPRPGPRGMGRPRHQVPPRPYTPVKSSRGTVPWLSHGLNAGISPRVGSSPRPPTPGTPHATTPGGGRSAPSPNGRRRGEEAFPEHFSLPSPNEHGGTGPGGPSPKARRVGARAFPERFAGSPQAALSPRVGFARHSPRGAGGGAAGGGFNVPCSPLDGSGSDRTYFPAPAASAAAAAAFATSSPVNGASRVHRRSSSSGWGTAPRHGGGGEGGVDGGAPGGGPTHVSSGFFMQSTGQSWGVRRGDTPKGLNSVPAGSRHTRGVTSGEISNAMMSNGGATPSPRNVLSASGGGTSVSAGTVPGNGRQTANDQRSSSSLPRANPPRRRHSSPIPPIPTSSSTKGPAEWANDGRVGPSWLKAEFPSQHSATDMSGGGGGSGNAFESFSATFNASPSTRGSASTVSTGWGSPAPPQSPMPEKEGKAWSSPAVGTTAAVPQLQQPQHQNQRQQASGGAASESGGAAAATAAAVAAVAAAAVPRNGTPGAAFPDRGDVLTPTMPVDV